MTFDLYTIKDELSEFGNTLVPFEEDAQAKRWFRDYVENNSMMRKNPEDFSLWKVGKYETKEAKLIGYMPELVERAKGE